MPYTHEEGLQEEAMLHELLSSLPTEKYVSTSTVMLNRPKAPRLMSIWRTLKGWPE